MGKKSKKATVLQEKKQSSSSVSRKRLVVWVGVTIFVSAWMFVLGIFVGRGTAPVKFDIEKLQKELSDLKKDGIKKELSRYQIDTNGEKNKTEMGFYESLKDTKKEISLNLDKNEPERKALPKKATSGVKKKDTSGKKGMAAGTNKRQKALQSKKVKTRKSLAIQVASFKDSTDANKMVAKLKKKGYPAYKIIGKVPEKGIWYRVRVGYYKNKTEANSMLSKLKKEKLKPILVHR